MSGSGGGSRRLRLGRLGVAGPADRRGVGLSSHSAAPATGSIRAPEDGVGWAVATAYLRRHTAPTFARLAEPQRCRLHRRASLARHNDDTPGFDDAVTKGLVITIEPIVAAGRGAVENGGDVWTIKTRDGSYAAHSEHTVVITNGAPLVLAARLAVMPLRRSSQTAAFTNTQKPLPPGATTI